MHRIVQAHLRDFTKSRGFDSLQESEQFEEFATFCMLLKYVPGEIELESFTTGEAESGIDGLAVIIDESIVTSNEEAEDIFKGDRRSHDVRFLAVQAKSGEKFAKGEILKFTTAVESLFIEAEVLTDQLEEETGRILETVIKNAGKVRGGKPSITAKFVTTGKYGAEKELNRVFTKLREKLIDSSIYENADVGPIGREELLSPWLSRVSDASARITLHSSAPLPTIPDIEESYLAVVRARDFVDKLLVDPDGKLRSFVFNENVRAFLGEENPINEEIGNTIKDANKRAMFPVLNNGITVISSDVVVQGTSATFRGFQIVNGCQTSHVLYLHKENLQPDTMVNLKIIETSNPEVISDLVRATNSQSAVTSPQFYSLKPISKDIEQYFNSFDEGSGRIYFERRERQYHGKQIPAIRIFNLKSVAKGVASMFMMRPDLSFRYQKQVFSQYGRAIFEDSNREIIFYAACLVIYRIHLLVASGAIPQNSRRFKWHLLTLVRPLVIKDPMPSLRARKMESYCKKLINLFSETSDDSTSVLLTALEILKSHTALDEGNLKRSGVGFELCAAAMKSKERWPKKKKVSKKKVSKKKVSKKKVSKKRASK